MPESLPWQWNYYLQWTTCNSVTVGSPEYYPASKTMDHQMTSWLFKKCLISEIKDKRPGQSVCLIRAFPLQHLINMIPIYKLLEGCFTATILFQRQCILLTQPSWASANNSSSTITFHTSLWLSDETFSIMSYQKWNGRGLLSGERQAKKTNPFTPPSRHLSPMKVISDNGFGNRQLLTQSVPILIL